MPKTPCLYHSATRNWHLRRVVPENLRGVIKRGEIYETYGAVDYRTALKLHHAAMAKWTERFAEAERSLLLADATPELIKAAASAYLHRLEKGAALPPFDEIDRERALELRIDDAVGTGSLRAEDPFVQRVAKSVGEAARLEVKPGSREHAELAAAVLRAMHEHHLRETDRFDLARVQHRDPAFLHVSADIPLPAPAMTVRQSIKAFQAAPERAGVAPKTRNNWVSRFKLVEGLFGADKDVKAITRADVRQFRDELASVPPNALKRWPKKSARSIVELAKRDGLPGMSAKSVTHYTELVSTWFLWMVREEYVPRNVAKGVAAASPASPSAEPPRRPFTVPELNTLFASYRFREVARDRSWLFWTPMIALFSGMRLAEIVGLMTADIAKRDGVWCFDLRPNEIRGLKTKQSTRIVPLHPELARLGFVEFVATLPPDGPLFSDLPGIHANRIDAAQRKLSRWIRPVFMGVPELVFHSFRHTWVDACREAYIPRDIMERLGGWRAPGSAMGGYGEGLRPSLVALEVAKIEYAGLNLTHL